MHKSLVDNREADRQKREAETQGESGKDEETNKEPENTEGGFDMNAQVLDEMERVYMLEINN